MLYYAFAVIVGPMGAETGWSRAAMHGAQSLGLIVSGSAAYFVGRHIDRRGGRGLMTAGAVLGAASILLWSQVNSLWELYAICVLIGVASSMSLYEAAFAPAVHLVPVDYRKAIIAITLLGGLASTAFIPLTHWLVETMGWRQGLQVLAVVELLVCVLIPWFLLPSAGPSRQAAHITARASVFQMVRRQPVFRLILVSYVCFGFFYTSLLFSLIPMLGERGISSTAAVGIYGLIGPSQVAGRLVMFATYRLLPIGVAGVLATVMPAAGMVILLALPPGSAMSFMFPVLFGAGMGIKTIVQATAAPEFLQIHQYGALQGILSMPVQLVQAASPFAAALIWQFSGDYFALEVVLLISALTSAVTFGLASWRAQSGRPRRTA